MFKEIFPDSNIAKNYHSARMKTTCILNGAIAPHVKQTLVEQLKSGVFSMSTDGSNDKDLDKINPITVKLFDIHASRAVTRFLDMGVTQGVDAAKASTIFEAIDEVMTDNSIPWKNCIAFSVDNTSANLGQFNSIKTRVLERNPHCYFLGCPCHILHNTAGKASAQLKQVSGFDIDDLAVDIFYYFDKSTKRKAALSDYTQFCDLVYRKMLKHVTTRWLSLNTSVNRILSGYEGLKSYFLSEDDEDSKIPRFARLRNHFENPMTEIYLMFFQAVIPTFTTVNEFLQRGEPVIHLLLDQLESFLKKLAGKFIRVDAIAAANKVCEINFADDEIMKEKDKMFVGITTRGKMMKMLNDGDLNPQQVELIL